MTSETLQLPQFQGDFHRPLPDICRVLLLGGRPPAIDWLHAALVTLPAPEIWAVDHGIDLCRQADLPPHLLIGDADSATPENWAWGCRSATRVERHPIEKDLTDTQLALMRAAKGSPSALLLSGAFGGRFDHAFSTTFSAAQHLGTCLLADEAEIMLFVHSGEQLSIKCLQAPQALSLLPLTAQVQGVTLRGTHWQLVNATLTQTCPNAVSNELEGTHRHVDVSVAQGTLGLYLCYEGTIPM